MRRLSKRNGEEADVDVTSFINLVIVLVPVLLMGMVLSRITVLDLKLPDVAASSQQQEEPPAQLELVVRADYFDINYPAGIQLKRIEKTAAGNYDYQNLTLHLQEIKRQLADKGIQKRDIYLLAEKNIDYQTLVEVMDTTRSFRAVVATSVVNAELFPEISLGDAPPPGEQTRAVAPATGVQP
ncbi:MAG: biopolymer transporter ExbD [Cellvibrio sp.]|uniref:ExbD/TolR family protein n=1 Tax=Cellvibrio sp. TaxID=1965322 RepID=UPI0031A83F2B